MTQLIDKAAIVAEIKKRKSRVCGDNIYAEVKRGLYSSLEIYINTLEVKEVDLEEHSMDYKVEGNIIYPDNQMLTWGPFYYHSKDKALKKPEEILKNITEWCNGQDPSLNIEPKNVMRLANGEQIIFEIQAWKDDDNLENCDGIITVEEIYFED